ncbi:unnamed protein product [Clonostachys solani]|uniref:Zn(2)-C6 fungal-type domain-containing protein n=1 Tax=Clonostachys solani TaxID=160281 RepID=A0A9P0ESJ8_9HYPO|nr:unnamed protein product [Clonostachys solani]
MPPRLYHTKSKTGCLRCRTRRVKCDETQPTCGGCTRHGVDCVYDRRPGSPSPKPGRGLKTEPDTFFQETQERRHRELRLLHVFVTQVCPYIPGTHIPKLLEIWTVRVPEMALGYEPLLHAILGFSCLYEATCKHSVAAERLHWRARYLEKTLQAHRAALGHFTRENADAVSFTTVVITLDAFAHLQERDLSGPYEPPMDWLQLSRGIGDVCKCALALLQDDKDALIWPLVHTSIDTIRMRKSDDLPTLGTLSHLLVPVGSEDLGDAIDEEAYRETVRLLEWIASGREAGEPLNMFCRRLTYLSTLLPARYVELLSMKQPRALVLLAHVFALCSYASDMWWVGGSARQEIKALQESGLLDGPEWEAMMRWPASIVAGEQSPLLSEYHEIAVD